jgi:hypothetical protein
MTARKPSVWHRGTLYSRQYDKGDVEIRNDVAAGWLWQLRFGAGTWGVFNVVRSLSVAKRQSAAEAKRIGWVPR